MKLRPSKLDQFATTLMEMDGEKKTLADMQTWLKEEGCIISAGALSGWLSSARQRQLQERLLGQIASVSRQCREVEKQFGRNPAPELETLIKLYRVLILQLSTQGNTDPEFLKLADQLMRTAMEYVSAQTKASHKERELKLAEEKFQLEFCEKILDQATREAAERIANSGLSQAGKIAAMRKLAFKSVDELERSGRVKIPKP